MYSLSLVIFFFCILLVKILEGERIRIVPPPGKYWTKVILVGIIYGSVHVGLRQGWPTDELDNNSLPATRYLLHSTAIEHLWFIYAHIFHTLVIWYYYNFVFEIMVYTWNDQCRQIHVHMFIRWFIFCSNLYCLYIGKIVQNILLFSTNCHFCLVCDENICQNKTQHQ